MSNSYKSLTVALDDDYHAEDIEALMQSIRLFRGVADVTMQPVSPEDWCARMRVRSDVQVKLFDALRNVFKEEP